MPKRQHDREVVLIPVEVRDSGADFPEPWASILQEALGRVLGDPDDPLRRLSHVRALFRVEFEEGRRSLARGRGGPPTGWGSSLRRRGYGFRKGRG